LKIWEFLHCDHFRNSQVAYFTRITDGTDAAAQSIVNKLATTAKAIGEDSLTGLRLSIIPFSETGGNNKFRVAIGNNGSPQNIQVDLPSSTKAGQIESIDTTDLTNSIVDGTAMVDYDYAVNDVVQFTIMPLSAFTVANLFGFDKELALNVIKLRILI
jgi:hypothetical protein